MSRKIKIEEKETTNVIRTEIVQVADMVAKEKGIDREDILCAMENAILKTAQMKYGNDVNLKVEIDRKSGQITLKRIMNIVQDVENPNTEISLKIANINNPEAKIGDCFEETLPELEFGRISAQSARQIIMQRVKLAERAKYITEFENKVGEIITGVIKRVEFNDIILDIGRTEGTLKKQDIIPNENFKIGDRIKVLLVSLNKDGAGSLLNLSRTHPDFLKKLFEQEVPEIYDGIIKIMAVARDPGSKAKAAVFTADPNLDPIGACVGIKGSRVQTIVDELKGEKIDIVLWDENPAVFIVKALASVDVLRLVFDEDTKSVEVVVPDDQFSLSIGRRGQNVRLASKLSGWSISVITDSDDKKKRAEENARKLESFMKRLDVDEMVAQLLISEGYSSVEEIAETELDELATISGLDSEIAKELKNRAIVAVEKCNEYVMDLCKEKQVSEELMNYDVIGIDLLKMLVEHDIKTLDDLGDLATDELLEITKGALQKDEAENLIMDIRKRWFEDSEK